MDFGKPRLTVTVFDRFSELCSLISMNGFELNLILHYKQVFLVFSAHLGLLREGYELLSQALVLFSGVCGVLHQDVSMCLRLLGRVSYIMGEYADVNILCFFFFLLWSSPQTDQNMSVPKIPI